MTFQAGEKILFIGDSITQDGRFDDPNGLGKGYVRLINEYIQSNKPQLKLEIVNKGISANRVTDLADRWEEDVLTQDADWISVSIGINDVWRQLDSPEIEQVSPQKFATIYDSLLQAVQQKTNARLILMEPTIIEEKIDSQGNILLKDYVEVVRHLAKKYDAITVSTHSTFINFLEKTPNASLTTDGVHMNDLGRKLMATTWLVGTGLMSQ